MIINPTWVWCHFFNLLFCTDFGKLSKRCQFCHLQIGTVQNFLHPQPEVVFLSLLQDVVMPEKKWTLRPSVRIYWENPTGCIKATSSKVQQLKRKKRSSNKGTIWIWGQNLLDFGKQKQKSKIKQSHDIHISKSILTMIQMGLCNS